MWNIDENPAIYSEKMQIIFSRKAFETSYIIKSVKVHINSELV